MGPEYQKREKARSSTKVVEAIVNSGDTVSSVADLNGFSVAGLVIPTIDTGDVTFRVCDTEDGTFLALKDKGGVDIAISAGTGNFAVSDSAILNALSPWRYVRIKAAAQSAERKFKFVVKA